MLTRGSEVTAELVRNILHYCPDTGKFTWVAPLAMQVKPGSPAGSVRKDGYVVIKIKGKAYKAHRVAWLYMTGLWPDTMDHIDRNPTNNRWSNLREATHAENCRNRAFNNGTGVQCVQKERSGRFSARVKLNGVRKYLGTFDTIQQAAEAVKSAKTELHKEFSV